MPDKVTLDALVPREDLSIDQVDSGGATKKQTLSIEDLKPEAFFLLKIRKPDFQRETNEWDPKRITDFIASFLDGDLIPSIILWDSGSFVFVIDGGHRLSALIAWINDDYGDGKLSNSFYENKISVEQIRIGEKTRKRIDKEVGSYLKLQAAAKNPTAYDEKAVKRARNLGSIAIQLQWVPGNIKNAEASFFKINQQAAPLDPTEIKLLKSRNKPNSLAARAIIRSGTGHKYWSSFESEKQSEIELIAHSIHELLFAPELETPIRTLDIPLAGKGYAANSLALIFTLINMLNDFPDSHDELADDIDGLSTIQALRECKKYISRITGSAPESLGLHPAVYFYGETGKYQKTAFFAFINLIKDKGNLEYYKKFAQVRKQFEEFIVKYKTFINQTVIRAGSGLRGYKKLQDLYEFILENLFLNPEKFTVDIVLSQDKFKYLNTDYVDEEELETGRSFNKATKSKVFLDEALNAALKCSICQGYLHLNSMSYDHKVRVREGGQGTADNAQITHPFCNTTYKN